MFRYDRVPLLNNNIASNMCLVVRDKPDKFGKPAS